MSCDLIKKLGQKFYGKITRFIHKQSILHTVIAYTSATTQIVAEKDALIGMAGTFTDYERRKENQNAGGRATPSMPSSTAEA